MTAAAAPAEQPWYQFVDLVDRLLADDDYLTSWHALAGIRDTVLHTRRVSDAQVLAVLRVQTLVAFGYFGGNY